MAENSNIEWCDHTFNPWMGCTKISPACDHCYAEVCTSRFNQVGWGAKADRKLTGANNWKQPLKWNKQAAAKGVRYRVFCASLADVFDNHKSIGDQWRADLWALIRATPSLDWLLLTKRPQNIARYLPNDWGDGYSNVWLGTTVENQEEANRRIPSLLDVPAKVHFLSCEPLLGEVTLSSSYNNFLEGWNSVPECCDSPVTIYYSDECGNPIPGDQDCCGCPHPVQTQTQKIDWVICGGESGNNARPMHPDWARSLRDQCAEAKVPFFFKQWGEWSPHPMPRKATSVILPDGTFLRGRNVMDRFEEPNGEIMWSVGKKSAGRELDGVINDGFPEVKHD